MYGLKGSCKANAYWLKNAVCRKVKLAQQCIFTHFYEFLAKSTSSSTCFKLTKKNNNHLKPIELVDEKAELLLKIVLWMHKNKVLLTQVNHVINLQPQIILERHFLGISIYKSMTTNKRISPTI